MRLEAARRVRYDRRTDFREYEGPVLQRGTGATGMMLDELGRLLGNGARIEGGLLGWAPYNATLFLDSGDVYHVWTKEPVE